MRTPPLTLAGEASPPFLRFGAEGVAAAVPGLHPADYALDLFAKLGLQLLIVTPLQKVHVIEPYVSATGFVDNPTGAASRVHTLTIEEFRSSRSESTGHGRLNGFSSTRATC